MRLLSTYCIITADIEKEKTYIISTDTKNIILPTYEVVKPRFLMNEVRYNIKKMFAENEVKFLEEILLSKIDIQNDFVIDYLSKTLKQFDPDNDVALLCCATLDKKIPHQLHWRNFSIPEEKEKTDNPLFYIIDFALQNV